MAYCPAPDVSTANARDTSPAALTVTPPTPTGAICNTSITSTVSTGGSTPTSTTTVVAGPPGPTGATGPTGPTGPAGASTIILKYNGTLLGTVDTINITSPGGAVTAVLAGTTGIIGNDALRWIGDWDVGTVYEVNDVVMYNPDLPAPETGILGLSYNDPVPYNGSGNSYICTVAHTSTADTNGTTTTAVATGQPPGSANWDPITQISNGTSPQKTSLLDSLSGLFDWTKKLTPLGWLATALGIGAALYLGKKLYDAMSKNGSSSTNSGAGLTANSVFTGTPTYTGAYTAPSIQNVVGSLCSQIWTSGTYDVSLLPTDQTCSLVLQQVTSIRSLVDQLSQIFLFDIVDSSGIIKFVPRNSLPTFAFDHSDMGFNVKGDSVPPVTYKRMQSNDLPRSVALTYLAADLDYNNYTQLSYITNFDDGQDVTLSVPLVLDHTVAKTLTEQILINAHLERQTYTFRTSYANAITIEPGDVGTIPEGNVRVMTMTEVSEGIIEFVCCDAGFTGAATPIIVGGVTIGYTASTYATSGQPVQLPAPPQNTVSDIGFTDAFWLEVPALNSSDVAPRFYAAINSYGLKGWPGAQIFKSVDNGVSYSLIGSTSSAATFGAVYTTLGTATPYIFDDTNTITVTLKYGTLSSATDDAILAGANLCMIGKEAFAFGVATLNSDGSYTLSHLLRGRLGTEYAISQHNASSTNPELFVMVDAGLYQIPMTDTDRGKPYMYKVVTIGSDISKVSGETVEMLGQNTIPWTVAQPNVYMDTHGDFQFSWLERPRFVNTLQDYVDVSHDPDFGGYAVAINSTSTTGAGNISVLSAITPGSGYIDGTYEFVPLTGGTGVNAQATFIVTGGIVTEFDLSSVGSGYKVNDILSVANSSLGGSGSGFAVTITTISIRTAFVTQTLFAYTPAMQIADFGSLQTHVSGKIYQVSNKYGGGQPITVTI